MSKCCVDGCERETTPGKCARRCVRHVRVLTDETTPATDGGQVHPASAHTAASPDPIETQPRVVDVELAGEYALVSVEQGPVSVVVTAPSYVDRSELERALKEVPPAIDRAVSMFVFEEGSA